MLQRIQTVFLLLIVAVMIASLFMPVWHFGKGPEDTYMLLPFGLVNLKAAGDPGSFVGFPYSLIAIFVIATITVAIFELFKFKNRLLQMKLGALNSLLLAVCMVLSVYFANNLSESLELQGHFGLFIFFPPVAMLFNLLANRFIRKDEKLVRSVDRIR